MHPEETIVPGDAAPRQPAAPPAGSTSAAFEHPGSEIGPYRLVRLLGEGGFGTVWLAERRQPFVQQVALKIIKAGMDSKAVVARFDQERQALAVMDHPHVAKVIDGGLSALGRPYFAMEFVRGDPINVFCDRQRLSIRQRLELFIQVCDAVQHAHTKGIIHRDLKPGNVLVALGEHDAANAKVIDFGIAKAIAGRMTDQTIFTETGQMIGTPEYMSPEQAEPDANDVDTRSDVYALGVILYELLVGATPFDPKDLRSKAYREIQRVIREEDPPTPSARLSTIATHDAELFARIAQARRDAPGSLARTLRSELEWIPLKAMRKERARRYASPEALAGDVRRYLEGRPLEAAPESAWYLARKFVGRHRIQVAAVGAVCVAVAAGLVSSLVLLDRARGAERAERARAEELKAVSDFQERMLLQLDPTEAGIDLMNDIGARFDAALERAGVSADERAARAAAFRDELVRVNATDAARAMLERSILAPAAQAVDVRFGSQPLVASQLRQALASIHSSAGLYDRAMPLQQSALETRRRELGPLHPDTIESVGAMGVLLLRLGRVDEGLAFAREELASCQVAFGDEDPRTMAALYDVGTLLDAQGKYADAEDCFRRSLEGRRRLLGDMDPETLVSLSAMASEVMSQDRLADAEPLCREVLRLAEAIHGKDDRTTDLAASNLGVLLQRAGRYSEAEPLLRRHLDRASARFGLGHPDTLKAMGNLGFILTAQGRYSEAEPLARTCLERNTASLGADHPATLTAEADLGALLDQAGKPAEAQQHLRRALEGRRRVLGPDHPDTIGSIASVAVSLHGSGELVEAESLLRDALERRRRVSGEDNPSTANLIGDLAALLADLGRADEAEALHLESLERSRRVIRPDHPDLVLAISRMGYFLQSQGRFAEAEPLFREALEASRRSLGDDHPETLTLLNNVGYVLRHQGKYADAEPVCREAMERSRRRLGTDHPSTLVATGNMGGLLEDQGRLADAMPLCREAMEGFARTLGEDHPKSRFSKIELARLLERLGRLDEAAAEFRSLLEIERSHPSDDPADALVVAVMLGGVLEAKGDHPGALNVLDPLRAALRESFADESPDSLALAMLTSGSACRGLGHAGGRFEEADSLLTEAHGVFERTRGPQHPRTRSCMEALVSLHVAWDAAEPGKGHDAIAGRWKTRLDASKAATADDPQSEK